ncbi:hypothetical protein [Lentzea sp.]|uniref:hypothetical protein n=1 Tax=Lentzea sp. TaxID=56099 RepID=UPI002ED2CDA9
MRGRGASPSRDALVNRVTITGHAREPPGRNAYRGHREVHGPRPARRSAGLAPARAGPRGLPLHPEQSTDAFVAHHPEAKYFDV